MMLLRRHPLAFHDLSRGGLTWRRIRRMPGPMIGAGVLLALILVALFAPLLAPHDPIRGQAIDIRTVPGDRFLLGADHAGRDVLSRLIYGARISLSIGLVVQSVALVLGTSLGLAAGYFGGRVDDLVSGVVVVLQAFPGFLLAIAVAAALEPGLLNLYIALGLVGWPGICRLVRGETLALKQRQFVEAARAVGSPERRILLRHILPNCLGPVIVIVTLGAAGTILVEAALSYLGLGTQPPTPSWGSMLAAGLPYIQTAPWLTVFPGLAIFLTILSLNLLGDGLRDVWDPRLRR
ncbi:MAG: ABC transporter permease [Actinomycetota bacterium]